jgi:hypothetical protein
MPIVGLDTQYQYRATTAGNLSLPGRVESAEFAPDQSVEHLTGAAGDDSVVYGMVEPKGSGSMWLQSATFPALALKTVINGLPPVIAEMQGGALGETVAKHTDCYLDVLEFGLEKDGALKVDWEWLALTHTTGDVTVALAASAKNLILAWYTGTVLLGGTGYGCQSVKARLENGIAFDTDLDAKDAGLERMPVAILPGNSKVSIDVEFNAAPAVDCYVAAPATVALVVQCKNTESSPKTFTLTVTNLHPQGNPVQIAAGEDKVTYKFTAEADYNDLTAMTFALA